MYLFACTSFVPFRTPLKGSSKRTLFAQVSLLGIRLDKQMSPSKRRPIILHHLHTIKHELAVSHFSAHDKLFYWATFTLTFYGFLQASEYTAPPPTHYDPQYTLALSDISRIRHAVYHHQPKTLNQPVWQTSNSFMELFEVCHTG